MVVGTPKIVPCHHHLRTSFTIHLQMLKGEDDGVGIMAKVDVNVEVVGKMAKWMQMLSKGEDDDMGMMAKWMQMLSKGEDDDMGMMAKWMQMLLKGEDDDMGMMAKVNVNVEGWGRWQNGCKCC